MREWSDCATIPELDTRLEVNDQLHVPLGKQYPLPIVQETDWAPELVRTLWRREKSLVPAKNRTPIPRLSIW
jgi:hypothetical protein